MEIEKSKSGKPGLFFWDDFCYGEAVEERNCMKESKIAVFIIGTIIVGILILDLIIIHAERRITTAPEMIVPEEQTQETTVPETIVPEEQTQEITVPEETEEVPEEGTEMTTQTEKELFREEYEDKKEQARYEGIEGEDRNLVDAVWLIYDAYYIDDPDSPQNRPSLNYNAKGNFYASVVTKENGRVLLVYNGESENGKCYLFVAEEEHNDENGQNTGDTSLLEFYAVNLEEQQVYVAHKTTWGGAESEEYRKATRD